MRITSELTDRAVLQEIGRRLARRRIDEGMTQAELADEAGASKRTVERIETGQSTDFVMVLRVLRVLKLTESLEQLVPDLPQSPIALLKSRGRVRKRVGRSQQSSKRELPWKWRE